MPDEARPITIIVAIMSALMLSACASNQSRISQFDQFAQAGTSYTESVASLLDASLTTAIKADNQVLIKARELNQDQAFLASSLQQHDDETRERAKILSQIRKQIRLMQDYFVALGVLASSAENGAVAEATSGLSESTKNLADRLGQLSSTIAVAKIGDQSVGDFLGGVVPVAVAAYQRRALDRALKATAEPVSRSISIHQAALDAIRAQMMADLELASEQERNETITKPFLSGGSLPAEWGQLRIEWLMRQMQILELDEAVAASEKLQFAFQALLEHRTGGPSFELLIRDLNKLVDFAEQLA